MADNKQADLPAFSKSQLASLFGLHRQTVASRLAKVAPCGKDKRGHDTFTIPKAALWLVDQADRRQPGEDEKGEINPDRLPPDMAKDYWDAQIKRQEFLRREGDLWETQQVVEGAAQIVKPIAAGLGALPDVLERTLALTPRQVKSVEEEVRRLRVDLHKNIIEAFGGTLSEYK